MKCFRINNYLTLRLENNKTQIYVLGEKFEQCKSLFINISINEIKSLYELSIDEMVEKSDFSSESDDLAQISLTSESEFWAHCSNLQVWSENNYNTCLLHSNLAFPLLKKLTNVGDSIAKRTFKEEIAKRIENGNLSTIGYLSVENFLTYLNKEEFAAVFNTLRRRFNMDKLIEKIIITGVDRDTEFGKSYFLDKIQKSMPVYFKLLIKRLLRNSSSLAMRYLVHSVYIKFLSEKEFWLNSINSDELTIIKDLEKKLGKKIVVTGEIYNSVDAVRAFSIEKRSITGLALEYCGLKTVPDLIKYLKNLKILDLKGNLLRNLSESMIILKTLKELEVLKLNQNKLNNLSESIGDLNSLKALNLGGNRLANLPDSIEDLKFLEVLNLTDNNFKFIPKPVYELRSLKELYVQSNKFVPNTKSIKEKMGNKDIKIIS